MSSQKTEHLGLHAWEPSDSFLRSEFNDNFSAIDAALAGKSEVVFGSYIGDDTNGRVIHLGFRPKAVIIATKEGRFFFSNAPSDVCGGVFLDGADRPNFSMDDDGFVVSDHQAHGGSTNSSGAGLTPHSYIAFR